MQRAWLLMAAGDARQHAGNDGYHDQIDAFYSWDSTVSHSEDLREGDPIALWDKVALIGVSVIEQIVPGTGEKLVRKCPNCAKASIKARSTLRPIYRCHACSATFDHPLEQVRSVKTFRATYAASWIDLSGTLTGPELRSVCISAKSQQSLRPLNWGAFRAALARRIPPRLTERVTNTVHDHIASEGHRKALTRARRGQSQFRNQLLANFGENCAITGPCPAVTLEAAHLYSYAEFGKHYEYGGLLLRRDVHRLFDRGDVAIHPRSLRIDVDPYVSSFEDYGRLAGQTVRVGVKRQQVSWLEQHWAQHRPQTSIR